MNKKDLFFSSFDRVKFGVSLDQVCYIHNDIPGPLLILILKLNKEGPYKKDVFRAPGHQANMKKLIHFLQVGSLTSDQNLTARQTELRLTRIMCRAYVDFYLLSITDWSFGKHR